MPTFSSSSKKKLATCHPDLQLLFNEVVKYWDCIILEGERGKEAQERAFANGTSTKHYPDSKHNGSPSMAVDACFYPLDWKDIKQFHLFAGQVLGIAAFLRAEGKMQYKIRWGGAWRGKLNTGDMLNDYVHFELMEK